MSSGSIVSLHRAEPAVRFRDVSVTYGDRTVVQAVTATLHPGTVVGLLGPNGAGKTTLIRALLGVLPLTQGTVLIHETSPREAWHHVSYLPQHEEVNWDFPVSVLDVVLMGRVRALGWLNTPRARDRTLALEILARVGMEGLAGLRGMAFLGNAMANAVFPGIVIAYLVHVDVLLGGLASGILVALGIGSVTQNRRLRADSAIGVLFVGAFALGVVLISSIRAYTRDLASILLGDILGVTRQDVVLTVATGCLVLLALYFFHKELVLMSFDREMAVAMGLPVAHLEIGLLLLLSLVIIVSIQAVGTVLVLALLVTPAATARLLTDRLTTMMTLAAALGILAGVVGLYASYYVNLASGGTIVLVATGLFFLTWLFSPRYGVVRRRVRIATSASGEL